MSDATGRSGHQGVPLVTQEDKRAKVVVGDQAREVPMSTTAVQEDGATGSGEEGPVDMKLEVVVLPVSDVEKADAFYRGLGWRVDADVNVDGFRLVQMTPPSSGCSIQFGTKLTPAAPGSVRNYLVVDDIEAARFELARRGAQVSGTFHESSLGGRFQELGSSSRVEGGSPKASSYGLFAAFSDPDGNSWLLQQVTTRLPGRIDSNASSFASVRDLADAMTRASRAHADHEKRIGEADPNWPDWYASYMVAEQSGHELPL
jgi:catechol 2,3-dioxygenase-like lactoylglutathione lyase family enzyme